MKSTIDRIKRFKRAYPEQSKTMTDKEILNYLNFHRQLKKQVDRKITRLIEK